MRINYIIIALLLPMLIVSAAITTATPTQTTFTIKAPYSGTSASSPLAQSGSVPFPLSPAQAAFNYNTQNALYLITCPDAPVVPYSSGNPDQYFYSTSSDFADWGIAGNLCEAPSQASSLPLTATLNVYPNQFPADQTPNPNAPNANVVLNFQNAMYTELTNIGYSPELVSSSGNVVSSSFQSKSYVFNGQSVSGQEGLWTWVSRYIDLSKVSDQLSSGLGWTKASSEQLSYLPASGGSCTYTYTLNSQAELLSVQNVAMPFPGPAGGSINTNFLPYLIYTANITNSEPSNQFNTQLSLDLYSPQNYYSPQNSIEPVTANSISLFFANSNKQLSYYLSGGVSINPYPIGSQMGLEVPYSMPTTTSTSGTGGGGGTIIDSNTCPNQDFPPGDPSQLSLSVVVACAQDAGFSGISMERIVAISYAESGWIPGRIQIGGSSSQDNNCVSYCGRGILQIDLSVHPGEQSIAYNPYASFQYAYSQLSGGGTNLDAWCTYDPQCNPQSTAVGAYCEYMPIGYTGPYCPGGTTDSVRNNIPSNLGSWVDVLNGLPSPGGGSSGGSSSTTTTSPPTYSLPVNPVSITSIPSGYIFAIGSYPGAQQQNPNQCQAPQGTQISEYGLISDSLQCVGYNGNIQEAADFLAIWAYYAGLAQAPTYTGNPLESSSGQPTYNPMYLNSGLQWSSIGSTATASLPPPTISPASLSTAQAGITNLASALNFGGCNIRSMDCESSMATGLRTESFSSFVSAFENGQYLLTLQYLGTCPYAVQNVYATSQRTGDCPKAFYTDVQSLERSCNAGNCKIPSDISSQINTWLTQEIPNGNAQGSLGSAAEAYLASATNPGYNLYIMHVVPSGYYNTSLYQPNSIQQSSSQEQYSASWTSYWKNVAGLQGGQSVYISNAISLSSAELISVMSSSTGASLNPTSFTPANITSDQLGDIFITGQDQNSNWWIVEVTNTIGYGPINILAQPMCPTATGTQEPKEACTGGQVWPEIAVSPTGSQIYLAGYQSGYILEYNSQLQYASAISLNFSVSNVLYTGSTSYSFTNPSTSPQATVPPGLNITDFLANGGLYGITTKCGIKGAQACTTADKIMQKMINNETKLLGQSGDTQDLLDKATWYSNTCKTVFAIYSTCNPNSNYHHPLGMQDINGYLFVFDDWYGITGEVCTSKFNGCTASKGGIAFNMPTVRIINSSGVDLPIDPTYYNDLWTLNKGHTALTKYTQTSPVYYPPFGWILSANISVQNYPGSGNAQGILYLNLCSGNSQYCVQNPESGYPGSLKPIGPLVRSWNCLIASCGGGPGVFPLVQTGFSVNYNYTISIYVPSFTTVQMRGGVQDQVGSPGSFTNMQGELLTASINPQNYTRNIGGNTYPRVTYSCYTGNSAVQYGDSSISDNYQKNSACAYSFIVDSLSAPVYLAPNPFEYDSNIGSYQSLALDAIYSSVFSAGSSLGSLIGVGGSTSNAASQTKIQNEISQLSNQYGASSLSTPPSGNLQLSSSNPLSIATSINSVISGYTVLPFKYTYNYKQWVSNVQPSSSSCAIPTQLSDLEQPTTNQYTAYNYTTSANNNVPTTSNYQQAQIESGVTYARSGGNITYLYQPNLTSVTLPSQILYNVLTNRIFGIAYINSTINAITNKQDIINATNQYTYGLSTYAQGGKPGYQMFTATPINPPCYLASCASLVAKSSQTFGVNNIFSAELQAPLLLSVFNWYKLPVYDLAMQLDMNGSAPNGHDAYGYHRLVYVFNDRFNNTIYMPLDVDIANATQINLTLIDAVNSINANQTTIFINGTVGWVPEFTTNIIPLTKGFVYLYYQANLNTIGYNAVVDPTDAARCVFANTTQPDNCQLANPVYNGLEYNSLGTNNLGYITPNIVTYQPAYNSMGMCSPPPNSLLEPIGKLYTLCNIYSSQAKTFKLPNQCPASALGSKQYCYPLYENGTGICTPQLGLIGVYPVNSIGAFSANVVACGSGTVEVTAQYYGTPGPEPIYAQQSPLPYAANPQSTKYVSFNAFNYSWAPATSSQITEIGSLVLSVGQISVLIAIAVLGVSAVLVAALKSRTKAAKRQQKQK